MSSNGILLVAIIPSIIINAAATTTCSGTCERTATTKHEGVLNYALLGHTIRILPTTNPFTCHQNCFMECRCLSYQISKAGCELTDEDRFSKPASFKERKAYKYYDIKREYHHRNCFCDGHSSSNTTCQNGCCKSQPCLNNGQCKESCDNPRIKLKCICPEGYTGKLCQIKARSCKDYIGNGTNGEYVIIDRDENKLKVICDFGSEKGFAWTLVESFSLLNNPYIQSYPFYISHPLHESNPNWNYYRLSYLHMKDIADVSTHFRATCQFPVEGVNYVDYIRGKLNDTDVLDAKYVASCMKYDYVNIRGHECHNCTAFTVLWSLVHIHVDGYTSNLCTLGRAPDALGGLGDDNFGYYGVPHGKHRCITGITATTQWWFGGP